MILLVVSLTPVKWLMADELIIAWKPMAFQRLILVSLMNGKL